MKKELEDYLERRIREEWPNHGTSLVARDTINEMLDKGMIQSPKQAWRTLEKWTRKRKWEYGCVIDGGWFTDQNTVEYWESLKGKSPLVGLPFSARFLKRIHKFVAASLGMSWNAYKRETKKIKISWRGL